MRLSGGVELRSGLGLLRRMKRLQEVSLVRGHAGGAVGRCARAVAGCGGPIVADFMGILLGPARAGGGGAALPPSGNWTGTLCKALMAEVDAGKRAEEGSSKKHRTRHRHFG